LRLRLQGCFPGVQLPEFQALTEQVPSGSFINSIVLVGSDGQQLMKTSMLQGIPLSAANVPAQARQAMETGLPVLSDLATGDAIKVPLASIAVPVTD
jgi:hypothetical protein